ncbi:hypothetical protein [Paenibacillus kyungheensis]
MIIDDFVKELIHKSKEQEIKWDKIEKSRLSKIVDRTLTYGVKEAYVFTKKDSVIIARTESRYYMNEEEYSSDDSYFLTMASKDFTDIVSYLENDGETSKFGVNLSRLYKLAKHSYFNAESRMDNFFD